MTSCPSLEILAAIDIASLDADTESPLHQHVNSCNACLAILHRRTVEAPPLPMDSGDLAGNDDGFPELEGFVIEEVLGRGGMAIVYRAKTKDFKRQVALKVLRGGFEGDGKDKRRWNREVSTLSRIPFHPNVVQFYNAGCYKDQRYLVLELVEGGTLRDRLAHPMAPREAAQLLVSLATAVEHLHNAGVLHLDIKPSNVLLQETRQGEGGTGAVPRLADFGISRLETPDATGNPITTMGPHGTLQYMAPEQVEGKRAEIGRSADIYGLGATFYHLLTGRAPVPSSTIKLMLEMVAEHPPVPPRSLIPSIPRDLETICLTCLQKKPSARYNSAQALVNDLERWLNGFPILAKPVSPTRKAWSWCCRRPVIAGLLATMMLVVLLSTFGFYTLWRRTESALRSAESASRLSDANYQETAKSLDGLISHVLDTYDINLPPGPFTVLLETARDRQLALRRIKPEDEKGRRRLAQIDRLLGHAYYAVGRLHETMNVFSEAVSLLDESLAEGGESEEIRHEQFESLAILGELGIEFREPRTHAEFLDWWSDKVELSTKRVPPLNNLTNWHLRISRIRRRIADRLLRIGEVELARSFIMRDFQLNRSLPPELVRSPEFVMSRLLSQSRVEEAADVQTLREVVASTKREADSDSKLFDEYVAAVTAMRFGWLPTLCPKPPPSLSLTNDTPEQWAERVLGDLETRCKSAGLGVDAPPRMMGQFINIAATRLTDQRKLNRFGEADRDTERYLALGLQCVDHYPKSYVVYLVLSEAYVQKAKNESRKDDGQPLVFLAKARDAARTAVSLAPEEYETRRRLDDRNTRYERYRTQK